MQNDDPAFVAAWNQQISESEKRLATTIVEHSTNCITKLDKEIRSLVRNSLANLKKLHQHLMEVLTKANRQRAKKIKKSKNRKRQMEKNTPARKKPRSKSVARSIKVRGAKKI